MNKQTRSDIPAFPELFDGLDQFVDELGQGIRRTSLRLAIVAIPSGALVMFALSKAT
jgi:hypothetical protein